MSKSEIYDKVPNCCLFGGHVMFSILHIFKYVNMIVPSEVMPTDFKNLGD